LGGFIKEEKGEWKKTRIILSRIEFI